MLIRVAPILGSGTAAAILGYQLANFIPVIGGIYPVLLFLGLFLSMIILDTEPVWNMVLFLGFALAAGTLLYWSEANINRSNTWILCIILLLISFIGGSLFKERFERVTRVFFPLTILYLTGWILFFIAQIPEVYKLIWIITGLVLFTLITIGVLVRGKTINRADSPIPLAIELFVIIYNICWLSSLL